MHQRHLQNKEFAMFFTRELSWQKTAGNIVQKAVNGCLQPNNEYKIINRSIATLKYFCIFNRSGDRVCGGMYT